LVARDVFEGRKLFSKLPLLDPFEPPSDLCCLKRLLRMVARLRPVLAASELFDDAYLASGLPRIACKGEASVSGVAR
jgi:hypothetical protein